MELKNWGMGKLKLRMGDDPDTGDDTEGKVHVTCRCRCGHWCGDHPSPPLFQQVRYITCSQRLGGNDVLRHFRNIAHVWHDSRPDLTDLHVLYLIHTCTAHHHHDTDWYTYKASTTHLFFSSSCLIVIII